VEVMEQEWPWFGWKFPPELSTLKLVPLADWHYGNPQCSPKHIDRTLVYIHDHDDVRVLMVGDLLECVTKTSKGDIFRQKITPQAQKDWVLERLMPVKDKILGMVMGNHEYRIYEGFGHDYMKEIANALGVPYRTEGLMVKISLGSGNETHKDRQYPFWGYITHGYGGARTKSGKAVKAERVGTWMSQADFVIMAHDHVVNAAPDVDLVADPRSHVDKETGFTVGKAVAHRKMLIKANASLKWGGYAEMGGFPPVDLETPLVYLLTPQSPEWEEIPGKRTKAVKVLL